MAFSIKGYSEKYWYWEVVILVRKLSLAAMSVLLVGNSTFFQGLVALIIVNVSLIVQVYIRPYDEKTLNIADELGLIVGNITIFLGLVSFDNQQIPTLVASVGIFLVNGLWFVFIGYLLWNGVSKKVKGVSEMIQLQGKTNMENFGRMSRKMMKSKRNDTRNVTNPFFTSS